MFLIWVTFMGSGYLSVETMISNVSNRKAYKF